MNVKILTFISSPASHTVARLMPRRPHHHRYSLCIVDETFNHPRALDAEQHDTGHKKWVGLIQQLALDITVSVEAMVKKNPAEWEKDGKMPEGCELGLSKASKTTTGGMSDAGIVAQAMVGAVFEQVCMAPWRVKMAGVLERALLRTLRRQPVVRVDM